MAEPAGLFEIARNTPKYSDGAGPMTAEAEKTVAVIREDEALSGLLAAQCALVLKMAREADDVDPTEKAYARVKLYDALGKRLDALSTAYATAHAATSTGALDRAIAAVFDPEAAAEDAEGAEL